MEVKMSWNLSISTNSLLNYAATLITVFEKTPLSVQHPIEKMTAKTQLCIQSLTNTLEHSLFYTSKELDLNSTVH